MQPILLILSLLHFFKAPPLPPETECAFCNRTVLDSQKFYEDDLVIALWNYRAALPGHSLIIPKRHVERFDALTDQESLKIAQVIKKVDAAARQVFNSSAYLLYQKNGREVGQSVPHVHFHYIPRQFGDDSLISLLFNICTLSLKKNLTPTEMGIATNKMKLAMESPMITFKHVDLANRAIVHKWLKEPHVAEWFYGQGLQNTLDHLDAFLNRASSDVKYWIAFDSGKPFAFFITSPVSKPADPLSKFCNEDGPAITLDMLIGNPDYLGKGLAPNLIKQFLLTEFPTIKEVLIDPEASNEKAIHVYKKAGFVKLEEFIPSHSPNSHIMMRLNIRHLKK